jgi:hypothetical protein
MHIAAATRRINRLQYHMCSTSSEEVLALELQQACTATFDISALTCLSSQTEL